MSRPFRAKQCLFLFPRALPWAGMSNPFGVLQSALICVQFSKQQGLQYRSLYLLPWALPWSGIFNFFGAFFPYLLLSAFSFRNKND